MTIGTVKFFNEFKGYGFIAPDGGGQDAFVHISAVENSGMRSLRENQRVSYELQEDRRGKMAAVEPKGSHRRPAGRAAGLRRRRGERPGRRITCRAPISTSSSPGPSRPGPRGSPRRSTMCVSAASGRKRRGNRWPTRPSGRSGCELKKRGARRKRASQLLTSPFESRRLIPTVTAHLNLAKGLK